MPVSLLLPIDDSPFSVAAVDEVARSLRPERTEIVVLHVLELGRMVPVALDFARGAGYGADVQAHLQTARLEAERLVGDAATRLRREGFTVTTSVQEGDPRHAIIDCASEHNC